MIGCMSTTALFEVQDYRYNGINQESGAADERSVYQISI